MNPKSESNPDGQDFIRNKVAQLKWLFAGSPESSWDLVCVDDGCDQKSGAEAHVEHADPCGQCSGWSMLICVASATLAAY